MMRPGFLIALQLAAASVAVFAAEPPVWRGRIGLDARVPWATSQVRGSPEPPPPFRSERIFPQLTFQQPVEMVPFPGGRQIAVVERAARVLLFDNDPEASTTQTLLDGMQQIEGLKAIYGLAFHPRFAENRECFLCYILEDDRDDGTRVSRFLVTGDDSPRIDPASESVLLTFRSGGHNGGSLKFGPDGCLYITTGDASPPDPPDVHSTGQDLSDLLASVLRIDVDQASHGRDYAIPADNPFLALAGARPEVYAYGFRNPWRMSFDRAAGDLWLGDVGWQLFEMVYRVERGGNYGWSVMEGPQPVRTETARGPTPVLPPMHALGRADAASVTGGFVYHGAQFPELQGAYIYGDYVTGKIWALRQAAGKLTEHRELTDTSLAIICFYEAEDGELAFLDYNVGTVHRLVRNVPSDATGADFPRRLSDTGLFTSTREHIPAPGVLPYSVNAPQWMDGATAERFIAIPESGTMTLVRSTGNYPKGDVIPADSVLVKTISIETEPGRPESRRRIETQILHLAGFDWRGNSGEWLGYSYLWNADQSDAELVGPAGADMELPVTMATVAGGGPLPWRVHSRAECYTCHNPWAGYRLGFTEGQLDCAHDYGSGASDQLETLERLGVLALPDRHAAEETPKKNARQKPPQVIALVDPADESCSLDDRARSYLHVNCAHCHRFGGGGTSLVLLDRDRPIEECRLLGERPTQGTFNLPHPALVQPGDPYSSVLYYRMAKSGRGHMPHIGAQQVDWDAVQLLYDWIRALPAEGSTNTNRLAEAEELAAQSLQGVSAGAGAAYVDECLSQPYLALALQRIVREEIGRDHSVAASELVRRGARSADPVIRDLFEQFLPPNERVARLGNVVDADLLLAMPADPVRGERLYFDSQSVGCRNCHRIGEQGTVVGPDLTTIGKQRSRLELLESILDPSRKIDPKFVSWLVETKAGQVHSGLLVARDERGLTLRTAENKTIEIPADEIEQAVPQQRSLMPDLLFRDLTAEQLADLLAYLASLQGG